MQRILTSALTGLALTFSAMVMADPEANSHAPIGVMGDHTHKAGEFMMSYRFMSMNMAGNISGSDDISGAEIVTTVANPFGDMPPTLRVVPNEMTMDMHMLGMMYAPTDKVTLLLMVNYLENEMSHTTYAGMMGDTVQGEFTTRSSGFGDTKVGALISLYDTASHKLHINAGFSVPTGSITEEAVVLAPTGMNMTLRMPYPMQLGSGTYDLLPGITYNGFAGKFGWGAQSIATLRTGENDENYTLGDKLSADSWLSYSPQHRVSFSVRAHYEQTDAIDGQDPQIMAPVQTAVPAFAEGDRTDIAFGVNYAMPSGHRLALEYQDTIEQSAEGVQMKMDDMLTVGYQYAF